MSDEESKALVPVEVLPPQDMIAIGPKQRETFEGLGKPKLGTRMKVSPVTRGSTPFLIDACRRAFADRIQTIEKIADGQGVRIVREYVRKKVEGQQDGMVLVAMTREEPSHRDRLQAMAMLAKYGRLDHDVEHPEMNEAEMMQAFVKAFRDPGVRQYIQQTYPDLLEALKGELATLES